MGAPHIRLGGYNDRGAGRGSGQRLQEVSEGHPAPQDGVFRFVQDEEAAVREFGGQGRRIGDALGGEAQRGGDGLPDTVGVVGPAQVHKGDALRGHPPAGDEPAGDLFGQFGLPHAAHALDEDGPALPQAGQDVPHLGLSAQEADRAEVKRRAGQGGERFHLRPPLRKGGPEGPVVVTVLGKEAELAGLRPGPGLPHPATEVFVQLDGALPSVKGFGDGIAGEEGLVEAAEEGNGGPLGHRLLRVHRHNVGNPQGAEGGGDALRMTGGHYRQAELRLGTSGGVEDCQELTVFERPDVSGLVLKNEVAGRDFLGLVAVAQVVEDGERGAVSAGH